MDTETKPRRLRIVSGTPEVIEDLLNRMLDDYVATVWSFTVVGAEVRATVVLVHSAELRKAQLAGVGMVGRGPH